MTQVTIELQQLDLESLFILSGLTQVEIAKHVGMKQPYVSILIKNAKHLPEIVKLIEERVIERLAPTEAE